MIEAAWSAVTVSVLRRDPAAAAAAVPAAVREGLLQTAGPAALLAVQSGTAGREVEALIAGLQDRDWPGDDVLIELLAAVMAGTVTGRVPLAVELDTLGDVLNDQRGGSVDLGRVSDLVIARAGSMRARRRRDRPTRACRIGWRCLASS